MTTIDLTTPVDAAARKLFEIWPGRPRDTEWEDLHPLGRIEWRNAVLPIVQAAVGALPDRDRGLWLEGYYAAESGIPEEACPYPMNTSGVGVWCAKHGPECPYGCIR